MVKTELLRDERELFSHTSMSRPNMSSVSSVNFLHRLTRGITPTTTMNVLASYGGTWGPLGRLCNVYIYIYVCTPVVQFLSPPMSSRISP